MKGMDWSGMMKQAQKQVGDIQRKMEETRRQLKERVVEGSAGGGMVKALVNGQQEVLKIEIDTKVVDPEEVEFLQEMVLAAVRQGLTKAKEMEEEAMGKVTGGLPLGGLGNLF